jgi:hypothetical protein
MSSHMWTSRYYVGVIQLFLLAGHMYVFGAWFAKDQRTNTIKQHT